MARAPRGKSWLSTLIAIAIASCSSSSPQPAADMGSDADAPRPADARAQDMRANDATAMELGPVQIPSPPPQSGVVYVAHYHTKELRIYRTDGTAPVAEPVLDLGKNTHDLELDPFADLLFVAADVDRAIDIYRLARPAAAGQPLTPPGHVATLSLAPNLPLFLRVNPHRKRLYAVVAPPSAVLVAEYDLHAWDVSRPESPLAVAGSPYKIPVTASLALDAAREVLFVVGTKDKKLFGYDLRGDGFAPLAGAPIELLALYPQENQFAFQARSLVVDAERHRLYAARSQSALSELIAIEYPESLPVALGELQKLDDPFDVDLPLDERPRILDAFVPAIDLQRGHVFLSAAAHDGQGIAALGVAVSAELTLGPSCGDFESFGCWYSRTLDGQPTTHVRTDGAACVDAAHRVFVGTSVAAGDETDPGAVHFFRYDAQLKMEQWLPADGDTLAAGGLPIAAVCH